MTPPAGLPVLTRDQVKQIADFVIGHEAAPVSRELAGAFDRAAGDLVGALVSGDSVGVMGGMLSTLRAMYSLRRDLLPKRMPDA